MAGIVLSDAEKMFIIDGVQENYRSDGRARMDYRPMEVETDIVSHASGSARLRLANTDVLVGIKAEVDVPTLDKKDQGKIEFFVDCSANATPEFEGRGGEQLGTLISNCLVRAYESPQAFDLKQLSIVHEKQCWKLYIDVLILECGGNLLDAVSLAVKAALFNTRIPRVEAAILDGGTVDLKLSDDLFDSVRLNIGCAPILVTMCKIGKYCIVDPSAEEEKCSPVSLVIGVMGDPTHYTKNKEQNGVDSSSAGRISTIITHGGGSLHPVTLKRELKEGWSIGMSLDRALGEAVLKEESLNKNKKTVFGFIK